MKDVFKVNNFDLIRLVAALQVAFHHVSSHLKVEYKGFLTDISMLFPGVPIFFFISGFLISKSYENNPAIKEYARNRILRIYPALIACTSISLLSVSLTGYFTKINVTIFHVVAWVVGQISFVQFYNPDFMRGFGTGVLNGSLWTITVELQFYVLIPVLYYWIFKAAGDKTRQNIILASLICLFMLISAGRHGLYSEHSGKFLFKLWGVSFIPWFYMFLLGVIFQMNFERMYNILRGRFLLILSAYTCLAYFTKSFLGWDIGNRISPVLYLLLSVLIFSSAYSFPKLGDYILRRNDISYGVYIYHIPVVNLFIYYGLVSNISFVLVALIITIAAASASWFLIEKPAFKLKKHSLNPLQAGNNIMPGLG